MRRVSRTGIDGSTPCNIGNAVRVIELSSPVLIGIIGTAPPYGLNVSLDVGNKRKSTSPGLVRKSQRLDTAVDRKFPNNLYSTSISSKVISDKLYDCSSWDLYTCCGKNFAADPVQTHTPQFVDLGIYTINESDEGSGLSAPNNIILNLTDGPIGERLIIFLAKPTAVGVIEAKSDYDYNYKFDFQIWNKNKEFERQNISMSRPPLDSTPVGTNMPNAKILSLDMSPVGAKIPYPKKLTLTMESSKCK